MSRHHLLQGPAPISSPDPHAGRSTAASRRPRSGAALALAAALIAASCGGGGGSPTAVSPTDTPAPAGPGGTTAGNTGGTNPGAGQSGGGTPSIPSGHAEPPPTPNPTRPDAPNEPPPAATDVPLVRTGATTGAFGPLVNWSLIPIHMALLPDGRVIYFGSDPEGRQTGQQNYAIWDPTQGNRASAHLLLANESGTDIFCTGQSYIASQGRLLMTGGDQTFDGWRNFAVPDVTFYDSATNKMIRSPQQMTQRRWYPTVVATASSDMVVLGGYSNTQVNGQLQRSYAFVPEVYSPNGTWKRLEAGASEEAYGRDNWYYPRSWAGPDGNIFVWTAGGSMFSLNPQSGALKQFAQHTFYSDEMMPAVQYANGRILNVRADRRVFTADIRGAEPVVAETGSINAVRRWSSLTIMADGQVLLSGGSPVDLSALNASLDTEIWNPATGQWTQGASGKAARLYHSNALLLPDATIVVGGGGAPGPLANTNAEIYYPPYLYRKDGSGLPATRPVISSAPTATGFGQPVSLQIQSAKPITKVNLIRHGSATHAFNTDQRIIPVQFTQNGGTIQFTSPADRRDAIPGYYMVFAIDSDGVPSIAKTIRIDD